MTLPVPDDFARQRQAISTTQVADLSSPGEALDGLAARLADKLVVAWRQGQCRPVEDFLAKYPELQTHPPAALRLVYEEFCLRQELGQEISIDDFAARFPQWDQKLRVLLDCHCLLEAPAADLVFPRIGDVWGDCYVLAELGRGAHGRVFLASQPALADRPVVLKLTPCRGREHLSLARLQHTGIVPLFFARDDPARNLRTLCMPYFGGIPLAQLLEALRGIAPEARTGEHIMQALDKAQEAAPVKLPFKSPFRLVLGKINFMQAICWIGAGLADALQYAHERGLVHLDIKPPNVLLAADGQPMLLDFHLAQAPIRPNQTAPERIGGTLAYMPREQQAAMAALEVGQPIATVVDARADIYSLGALLYEALGGKVPVLPGISPPLHRCNPQVSVGLSDIIARCLAWQAGDRYADAAALAADLRRHLHDQKLKGVRNRSWGERWQKWRRRSPGKFWMAMLAAVAVGAIALAADLTWHSYSEQVATMERKREGAQLALTRGQELVAKHHYDRAVDLFKHGLNLIQDNPDVNSLWNQLRAQLDRVRQLQVRRDLHRAADWIHQEVEAIRYDYVFGSDDLSPQQLRRLQTSCATAWDKRRAIMKRAKTLPAADKQRLQTDLFDLAVILSDVSVRLAPRHEVGAARRHALEILDEAEKLFGPSAVLERERLLQEEALGDRDQGRRSVEGPLRTAWDHCLLARSLMRSQQWRRAEAELDKALDLEPQGFWPNYYQAVCAYESRHYHEAVNGFRVCIALKPTSSACFFNRAQAHAALKQSDKALANYRHVLKGGMDLIGIEPATVHYRIALIYEQQGDRKTAVRNLKKALLVDPQHQAALGLWKRLHH
jgi:tetratricopeptide (TPR) repeat protein